MKPDFYTKAVLTVIALCLVALTLHTYSFVPTATAANAGMPGYATVPVNKDGSINVRLNKTDVMDVNIESCSSNAFYMAEPIEVKVQGN